MNLPSARILTAVPTLLAASLVLVVPAAAHDFHGDAWLHPLTGVDHLLAMLAVGAWSAQLGGRAIYAVPAAFVLAMAGGSFAAGLGWPVPAAEILIAGSVILLGLAIALDRRWALPLAFVATGLFGYVHGYAHGLELRFSSANGFVPGFLITTATLHLCGALGALWLLGLSKGRQWLRAIGAAVAAAGIWLFAGAAGLV